MKIITVDVEMKRFETANRHIVATEERIDTLRRRIAKLSSNDAYRCQTEELLTSLVDTLGVMRRYRQQVLYHLVEARARQRLQRERLQHHASEE